MLRLLLLFFFTTPLVAQTMSEKEINTYTQHIDSLRKNKVLKKVSFPDMSFCGGGLEGYFDHGKLVFIDATYNAELGYSRRKVYFKDSTICKITYREHFAEWGKYEGRYPSDKFPFDPSKMTYTDTVYSILFTNPVRIWKSSGKKWTAVTLDQKKLDELTSCAFFMRKELLEYIVTNPIY